MSCCILCNSSFDIYSSVLFSSASAGESVSAGASVSVSFTGSAAGSAFLISLRQSSWSMMRGKRAISSAEWRRVSASVGCSSSYRAIFVEVEPGLIAKILNPINPIPELFSGQTSQCDRVEFGEAGVAARSQHAGNFGSHDHRCDLAAAHVRGSLEEDVARFDVGEEQAVRIACDGRTLDLLDLGGFLVKRYVERQRTVDDDVTQLSAIAHLGEQSGFGRGEHARQQLLRRCDAGDLRRLDTDQVGDARQVADKEVVRELVADTMTVDNVRSELEALLYNKVYRNKMLEEYDRIIQILGPAGASEAAARKMVALLKK